MARLRQSLDLKIERLVAAVPSAIDCLWSNWELFGSLTDGYFEIHRLSGDPLHPSDGARWASNKFGFSAEWELVSRSCSAATGTYIYYCSWTKWGLAFRSRVQFTYRVLSGDETRFCIHCSLMFPRLLRFLYWPLEGLCYKLSAIGADLGQQVSERLTREYRCPQLSSAMLPFQTVTDAYMHGKMYTEHQPAGSAVPEVASSGDGRTGQSSTPLATDHDRMWDAELRELSGLYNGFRGKADSLAVELERIKDARDAVATLLIARRMLELIVSRLAEMMLQRPRGSEPLAGLIDKLDRLESIPDYVCTSMRNLNGLSTYGAHPKVFSPRQVREALIALCSILEWHVSVDRSIYVGNSRDAPCEPVEAIDAARQEYRYLCKMAWVDGVMHDSERKALEQKRTQLNISIADARQIEAEFISE